MTENLLNFDLIQSRLTHQAAWADSHGADGDYLGAGLLYYTLVYMLRAETCVCIGSGGGFVPRMMRQAQSDLNVDGETHLVDANLSEAGWGSPKWIDETSFFRAQFPDIRIHITDSQRAAKDVFQNIRIDYLHIDGDHSFSGGMCDFWSYAPLMAKRGIMTFHDTTHHQQNENCEVHRVLKALHAEGSIEMLDFPFVGAGTAIVRLKNSAF